MITILMAHHNQSAYAKRALQSIVDQTDDDWRLIVCDDRSTDAEYRALEAVIEGAAVLRSKATLIRNQRNLGYIGTLKRMIAASETEVVGIVDADDALARNAVEVVNEVYRTEPDVGFTYSDSYICDEFLIPFRRKKSRQIDRHHHALTQHYIDHFRTFKTSVYRATAGYDERYLYAEDQDVSYKLEEVAAGRYIAKPLYYYRQLPSSQSKEAVKCERGKTSHLRAITDAMTRRQGTAQPRLTADELRERIASIRRFVPACQPGFLARHLTYAGLRLEFCVKTSGIMELLQAVSPKPAQLVQRTVRSVKELVKGDLQGHAATQDYLRSYVVCQTKGFAFVDAPFKQSAALKQLVLRLEWGLQHCSAAEQDIIGYRHDRYLRSSYAEVQADARIKTFLVLRDPVERALAAFRQRARARRHPDDIEAFVDRLERQARHFDSARVGVDLVPQAFFAEGCRPDFCVREEDLSAFVQLELGFALESTPGQGADHDDAPSIEAAAAALPPGIHGRIQAVYRRDYDLQAALPLYAPKTEGLAR